MNQEEEYRAIEKSLKKRLQDAQLAPPSFQQVIGDTAITAEASFLKKAISTLKGLGTGFFQLSSIAIWLAPFAITADLPLDTLTQHHNKEAITQQSLVEEISAFTHGDSVLYLPKGNTNKVDQRINTTQFHITSSDQEDTNHSSSNPLSHTTNSTTVTQKNDKTPTKNTIDEQQLNNHKTLISNHTALITIPKNVGETENVRNFQSTLITDSSFQQITPLALTLNTITKHEAHQSLPNPSSPFELKIDHTRSPKGYIYLGAFASINSSWIFNQNTYGQFGQSELAYKKRFRSIYGFKVGYQAFKGFGVEFNFIPNAHKGQSYRDEISGIVQDRKVSLTYLEIPFWLKYRFRPSLRTYWGPEIGISYTKLRSAEQYLNGNFMDLTERFQTQNWNAMLGIGAEFVNRSHTVSLSLALRAGISNDINADAWQVNDSYGKSHNFTLGAQIGVNYHFSKVKLLTPRSLKLK